jgi:transposase
MDAFIWPSAETTECWMGLPNVTEEEIARRSLGALSFSSAKMGLCLTIPCQLAPRPMAHITAHSCRIRWGRPALRRKQPELLERGAILLQDNATPHRHCDVQNLVQRWGWEVLAHPPYSPDFAPCDYWLFSRVKEHVWGKRFESEDDINTAVTASLASVRGQKQSCNWSFTT